MAVSQGKQIPQSRFADDDGSGDPAVLAALLAAAEAPADVAAQALAVAQLSGSRVLVPVLAVLDELESSEDGRPREKNSHMSTAVVAGADGSTALLGFTSMDSLQAWEPSARPMPVTCREAAESTVGQGADALVVDVASAHRFVLSGTALKAVAQGWRLVRVDGELAWVNADSDAGA